MTRRLVLMRHARALGASAQASDHERPLDPTGHLQAADVAQELIRRGWAPDRVLSSDAMRARETAGKVVEAFPGVPSEYSRAFYSGGADAAAQALASLPSGLRTVLLVGHNPEWERLVAWLSGQVVGLGTGNAALLEAAETDWPAAIRPGAWTLTDLVRPP